MSISPQDAERRRERFVAHVRAAQSVWVLMLDGGIANFDDEGVVVVPVWSTGEEARAGAAARFPRYLARELSAVAFLDLLESLSARGAWVAVEPTADLAGESFPAGRFSELVRGDGV